MTDYNNQ
jgi:hypothetical protein